MDRQGATSRSTGIADLPLHGGRVAKILLETYERRPQSFERLLALSGVGPRPCAR